MKKVAQRRYHRLEYQVHTKLRGLPRSADEAFAEALVLDWFSVQEFRV